MQVIKADTDPSEILDAYRSGRLDEMRLDPGMTANDIVAFLTLHGGREYSAMLLELALRHSERELLDTDALLSIFAEDAGALSDVICTGRLSRGQLTVLALSKSKMVSGHARNALMRMEISESEVHVIEKKLKGYLALDELDEEQYSYCALAASHPKTPRECLDIMMSRGDTLAKIVRARRDRKG